jgi:small subunit ribosomal protein S14
MAGILLKKKNIKIRINKDKSFTSNIINSYIAKDSYLSKDISFFAINKNYRLKNSTISKIKNKCLISGRNRAVLKKFKLNRMFLKNLGVSGTINGLRKSSW